VTLRIENVWKKPGIELPTAPVPKANYNIIWVAPQHDAISGSSTHYGGRQVADGRNNNPVRGETVVSNIGYTAARHCGSPLFLTLTKAGEIGSCRTNCC
jgi:hypothetical protein